MAETTFTTDFTYLVALLSKDKQISGLPILRNLDDPTALAQVNHDYVASLIKTLSSNVSAVESALEDSQALVQFFKSHLEVLKRDLARSNSIMAPIRRLPVEILQEIFLFAKSEPTPYGSGRHTNAPPNTSQVNQHWRRIALATPRLWTTALIRLGTDCYASQVNTLELIFERCGPFPVSLLLHTETSKIALYHQDEYERIDDQALVFGSYEDCWYTQGDFDYEERETEVNKLVEEVNESATILAEAIIQYAGQLGSITIPQYSDCVECFLDALKEESGDIAASFDKLKVLSFPSHTREDDYSVLPFNCAPNLARLLLINSKNGCEPNVTGVPWKQLEVFRGPLCETETSALFSSGSERLKMAEIVVDDFPLHPPAGNLPYPPLQYLTSLYLDTSSFPESSQLVPPLPALRHLLLQPACHSTWNLESEIMTLVEAWGPQLLYFGLDMSSLDHPKTLHSKFVHDIIVYTPNLEAIALPSNWSAEFNRVTHSLHHLSHIEVLCPSVTVSTRPDEKKKQDPARWTRKTLSRLRTLTFLAGKDQESTVNDVKAKVGGWGLGVEILHETKGNNTRLSTPYFRRQGGLFTECLADDEAREQAQRSVSYKYY